MDFKNIPWKTVIKYGAAITMAVASAVMDQRKAEELDEMKKFINNLKEKES